ncbi:hypothetical protein FIV07_28075 (plasmid) [Mycobacterium sp. THAF192]|nr:hypothetical protein FIV07_28075 [Mycobacterium sp. THAF192]
MKSATVKSCLDWRAEIRLSPLDAHGHAPDVIVGWVDFLVLQLGREPVGEVLGLYGEQAARFEGLFDGPWLEPELDESDGFTAGMPIGAVLVVAHHGGFGSDERF